MTFFRALGLFWAIVVSGTGLAAAYLAADAANVEWLYWGVVGVAALIAVVNWLGPRILDSVQKVRDYPAVLQQVVELRNDLKKAKDSESSAQDRAKTAYEKGQKDGESRVIGSILAAEVSPPTVAGIAAVEGNVVLVARNRSGGLPSGARFVVRSTNTAQAWGVVEVGAAPADAELVPMRCVEPIFPKFWEALSERVLSDDTAPSGIELEPYQFDLARHYLPSVYDQEKDGRLPIADQQQIEPDTNSGSEEA